MTVKDLKNVLANYNDNDVVDLNVFDWSHCDGSANMGLTVADDFIAYTDDFTDNLTLITK